jgi:hypothetical protein
MLKRAVMLRNPIDTFILQIRTEWEETLRKSRNAQKKIENKPTILDDALTAGDWGVLSEYLEILTPLKEATARLEGRAIQGNYFNSY